MNKRGTLVGSRPTGLMRALFRAPIWLYRAGLGFLLGGRFLMVEHTGRRSGKTRYAVLEVARHDSRADAYVVISGWGMRSDWVRNVRKTPDVRVSSGFRRRVPARAVPLPGEAAVRELCGYADRHPAAYRVLVENLVLRADGPVDCVEAAAKLPVVVFKVRSRA